LGSLETAVDATTTGAGGGVGFTITLITASETFAAFKVFNPSTDVSNFNPSPDTLRIFAMITSSERPMAVISITS
jgi:hypothetical protein